MSAKEFQAMYCGTFEVDQRLFDLGMQYHHRCDAFDDAVCTGPTGRDGVLPANGHEMALINRNAADVRRDVVRLGEKMGYTKPQIADAIRRAGDSAGESR